MKTPKAKVVRPDKNRKQFTRSSRALKVDGLKREHEPAMARNTTSINKGDWNESPFQMSRTYSKHKKAAADHSVAAFNSNVESNKQRFCALRDWSSGAEQQTDNEQHQEQDKEHLCNPSRTAGQVPETQYGGNQCYHQKHERPVKHDRLLFKDPPRFAGLELRATDHSACQAVRLRVLVRKWLSRQTLRLAVERQCLKSQPPP
jgi:hypothetical protein